ncbi:hypothetical protein F2Q68_00032857 [Brassica cretica]|uniref:Uncharacterized protein n=1 Tax=Brassica cretica TaxID=69181 RepID=A0A8S9GJA7_BRACR|nr:hypothetical protein F2Q68_00032857 [Brassica cretica]
MVYCVWLHYFQVPNNVAIYPDQVSIARSRINQYLSAHGYNEEVLPELYLIHANGIKRELKEELVRELERENGKSVTYIKEPESVDQPADSCIKTELELWCERNQAPATVILLSLDKDSSGEGRFVHTWWYKESSQKAGHELNL